MTGILLLVPGAMGQGLTDAVTHIFGEPVGGLATLAVDQAHRDTEDFHRRLDAAVADLDRGQGVLILADIFGASHTNTACRLLAPGRVELVSGVNLPMLLRVLNHRGLGLEALADKAVSGGVDGILRASLRHSGPSAA